MTLPPGRARLVTSPFVTGSSREKTMGRVLVACLAARAAGVPGGHDDINLERNQFGRKSGEPFGLPHGSSGFDHDVATLDVAEVTQSLEEGLVRWGFAATCPQEAYSSDLGRLLGLGGNRAEEPTEQKGDAEGEPQPYHLGSGPSNLFPRRFRIGPTSLWSRPRSLTPTLSGRGRATRAAGPLEREVGRRRDPCVS